MIKSFSLEQARAIGKELSIDFSLYDVGQFRQGLEVELEHCNVTGCDPLLTGKIAQAHLDELPDYYTRLAKMEKGGNSMEFWTKKEIADKKAMEEASKMHRAPFTNLKTNEVVNKFLPMMPEEGPPLPRVLNIHWPWKK